MGKKVPTTQATATR